VGVAKIEAMAQRIALINPHCQVQGIDDFVSPDNWARLVPPDADAVIDACDQVLAKTAMAQWAIETGTVFITVGAAGGATPSWGRRSRSWIAYFFRSISITAPSSLR
jgi:tRNA A37 threonylcarbamoyladenosine dehydratase